MPSWEQDTHAARCVVCGAALARDQRYCVECGTRRLPLPAAVRQRIESIRDSDGAPAAAAAEQGLPAASVLAGGTGAFSGWSTASLGAGVRLLWPAGARVPRPAAAAVAVLACLGFGVAIGAAVKPKGASPSSVLVADVPGHAPSVAQPKVEPPASEPAATPEVSTAPATPKASAKPAPTPAPAKKPTTTSTPAGPLPPVKHVFEIVLSEHGYSEAFGASSTATYLAKTLTSQGELISNYYAVAGGALANEIALISGQGPTPETDADCPSFSDITPGTVEAEDQVKGTGCVYPASTDTLAGELTTAGKTWKAYVEGVGSGAAGEASTCRHPALGSADPDQVATPSDPYVTWRNPFVYFHSLIDGKACAKEDVGLEQLAPDLKTAADTPSLSYIVPDRCHDGAEEPCAPGAPDGLAAADTFLEGVVPEIEASPAYREGGLIAITFDEAPQSGPNADPSACCETPAYPNLAGLTTTTTTSSTATSALTTTSAAGATTTTTTTSPAAGGGETTPTGGGGHVGLLLISPYVKPGSVSEVFYDHFSLLLSIEELFSLKRLGYTSNPALVSFGRAIYNGVPASG